MNVFFKKFTAFCLVMLLGGCVSPNPNAEFVKSINFSSLETFSYQPALLSGIELWDSEKLLLEKFSEQEIIVELQSRDFELVTEDADFSILVKWKKAVSSYPSPFDHIDGYNGAMNQRDNPTYKFNTRFHLTIEIYESSTQNLFWASELPNVFDAIQLTQERVVESLSRGIKNFPNRIEKDTSLPDIQ